MLRRRRTLARPTLFLVVFGLTSMAGLLAIAAVHLLLASRNVLAPPPYVATWCIDQKLDFLARSDLEEVELAAIGSSGAWRNLDMTVFVDDLGLNSINAAPCLLFASQTAYLAEYLLPRMPKLEVLVVSFLARDFEQCVPEDEKFFDQRLLDFVSDGRLPRWLPYISGFRPMYLANFARARAAGTGDVGIKIHEDGLGSAVMIEKFDWWPELTLSDACYAHVTRLEELTQSRNVTLVLALAPNDPVWRAQRDPDGSILSDWQKKLRASVSSEVIFIDSAELGFQSDRFADPYHLMHPNQIEFSRFIAGNLETLPNNSAPESTLQPGG